MAKIGYGYGSEWNLLWYLGRHRQKLSRLAGEECRATEVDWVDFQSATDSKNRLVDREWKGLEFLPADHPARVAWEKRWPHGSGVHNWDALARIAVNGSWEWLFVEAKAHVGEIGSSCTAEAAASLVLIQTVFDETKAALGVASDRDWLGGHYQFANRVAVLHHLLRHDVPSHLLFIYFTGDRAAELGSGSAECPTVQSGWKPALDTQAAHIGISPQHALSERIHKLFLPAYRASVRKAERWHRDSVDARAAANSGTPAAKAGRGTT